MSCCISLLNRVILRIKTSQLKRVDRSCADGWKRLVIHNRHETTLILRYHTLTKQYDLVKPNNTRNPLTALVVLGKQDAKLCRSIGRIRDSI